ncbi:alpha/beta hydrolase [Humisphaera borealis]|uniref:Alpha/beta hydrolase n=1 Tax=Humisphaera borealis TaxID=2807512 RepID=A0A7M2WY85_9BACT|nr:prolyl oligopeptidase family serine peptidase [Humisphaera borealis]QOV90458.1 alpha/beta hydrolase [Humisphaera borealis]
MSRPLMQRPVMDPLFLQELQAPPGKRRWVACAARGLRWVARKLLSQPLTLRRDKLKFAGDSRGSRWAWGVAYRLLFAPLAMALVAGVLVFSGTHPQAAIANGDPASFGVYYDPVEFASGDGTRLTGWLVPVVDARRVLLHKDRLLHQKHPAVVLVHDHGQSPAQMLPLIAPLHEEGIVVLAVGLRGVGTVDRAPQTFGLDESMDVKAAVNLLRGRPFVDDSRIAVIGLGTGANAVLLAAEKDEKLFAIVLADPIVSADEVVASRLGPDAFGLRWMQPLTKWAFEIGYRQDVDEISLNQHTTVLTTRKVLRVQKATIENRLMAAPTEEIRKFCRETLRPWDHDVKP